jgi:hypothetical protein
MKPMPEAQKFKDTAVSRHLILPTTSLNTSPWVFTAMAGIDHHHKVTRISFWDIDVAVRHAEAFSAMQDALTS